MSTRMNVFAAIVIVLLSLSPAQAESQAGRPVIILLHGRAQAWNTAAEMERDWFAALDDGLEKIGGQGLLMSDDRRFIRYEWVYESDYRPSPSCGGKTPDAVAL